MSDRGAEDAYVREVRSACCGRVLGPRRAMSLREGLRRGHVARLTGVVLLLFALGCDDKKRDVPEPGPSDDPKIVVQRSPALPDGLAFGAGFPTPGTVGSVRSDDLGQPWLVPCEEIILPADSQREGAYSIQATRGASDSHLIDKRQLVVFDDSRSAAAAMDELATALRRCDGEVARIRALRPVAGVGDESLFVKATVQPSERILDDGVPVSLVGAYVLVTRSGRAIVTTGVPFNVGFGDQPELPLTHTVAVDGLCIYAPSPCKVSGITKGAGALDDAWLPTAKELHLTSPSDAGERLEGEAAAAPPLCGQASLSSLGAVAALRKEFGEESALPRAAVILTEYPTRHQARRAQAVLTSWVADCARGVSLSGYRGNPYDNPCWIYIVEVPNGEARKCSTNYETRTDQSTHTVETGVLRVGKRIAVVENSTRYDESRTVNDVPRALRLLSERLGGLGAHESTYDGGDIAAAPVELGLPVAKLQRLVDPLQRPDAYGGCARWPLRTGSTALVDQQTDRVVAYELGGADMTPRGLTALSPMDDAVAAYPEGQRLVREGYDGPVDELTASLPDGSAIRYADWSDRAGSFRVVRVWLEGARCGTQ